MNKKLLITFISLAVVVLLVVLACAIFIVGNVTVETTSDTALTEGECNEIIVDSKIAKFSSIFALSEEIATANIESKHPTLQVVQIERKFPNKVVINVSKRTAIMAVKTDQGYVLLDKELKVIGVEENISDKFLAQVEGLQPAEYQVGMFIKGCDYLTKLVKGAEEMSFLGERFGAFFTKVELLEGYVHLTTNTGVVFRLNICQDIDKLLKQSYNFYLNVASSEQKKSGYIVLTEQGFSHTNNIE